MRLRYVEAVLSEEDINALKEKVGEPSIKDAISKAVDHFLKCKCSEAQKKVTPVKEIPSLRGMEAKKVAESRNISELRNAYLQMGLGNINFRKNQQNQALKYYETALNIFRQLGDKQGEIAAREKINNINKNNANGPNRI